MTLSIELILVKDNSREMFELYEYYSGHQVIRLSVLVRVTSEPSIDLTSFHNSGTVAVNLPLPHGPSMAPRE